MGKWKTLTGDTHTDTNDAHSYTLQFARSADIRMKRKAVSGSSIIAAPRQIHIYKKYASRNKTESIFFIKTFSFDDPCEYLCRSGVFALRLKYARGAANVHKTGEQHGEKWCAHEKRI